MYICTTFENVPPRKTYYVFFRKLVKKTYVYVPEKMYTFPKKRVRTSFWTYIHLFPGVRGHANATVNYVIKNAATLTTGGRGIDAHFGYLDFGIEYKISAFIITSIV
jgi:hypothetical protein